MDEKLPLQAGASLSDLLTTLKNTVQGLNALSQNFLNVQGLTSLAGISTPTVVKMTAGRVCRVSITTAGSATGLIYDTANQTALTKPLWVIPMALAANGEPYEVNMSATTGIYVVPGTGMTLALEYS